MSSVEIGVLDFQTSGVSETVKVGSALFEAPFRPDLMSQVINWQLAKRRAGTHKTKGISEVSGTTRKPYRQKGTGRARQGSLRSPQFRTGGVIFGPVVRQHGFSVNKKVRNLALRSALSLRFSEGRLFALRDSNFPEPKASELAQWVSAHAELARGKKLLIVIDQRNDALLRAASNLHWVKVLWASSANVYDLVLSDFVLLEKASIDVLLERLSQ
ncbi:50S ribosomal protein L4 [Neorickettsia helminthoeca str. Oregon]|uniref:Large ribosomal subunit protein uL4 n=1 Tax=Neorickettsia helminthoeca str. Oregon TaxID=1286528 RepID=X5H3S2_9RICK|nr:50S ribosomal protein L4 [Neorickettsia helminthoeca]AHX11211.1 50S ribosomal protein L4 [Neorickettsia helminthoeca str. Oregon]